MVGGFGENFSADALAGEKKNYFLSNSPDALAGEKKKYFLSNSPDALASERNYFLSKPPNTPCS